jgi:hypothetical protein
MGVPVPALDGFRKAMEGATGTTIEEAATELSSFASKNDAEMAANLSKVPAISRMANQLKGYLMEARQNQTDPAAAQQKPTPASRWQPLWAGGPVLLALLVWRVRRGRQ